MRWWIVTCAALALALPYAVGCKTSGTDSGPTWSLSSWNPFKSKSDTPPYPELPSRQAQPTPPGGSNTAVASTAGTSAPPFRGNTTTATTAAGAGRYGTRGYSTGQNSYASATSATSNDPYTTPQQGYYSAGGSYPSAAGGERITATDPSRYTGQLTGTAATNPYTALDRSSNVYSGSNYASDGSSPYVAGLDRSAASAYPSSGTSSSYVANPYYDATSGNQPQSAPYSPPYAAGGTNQTTQPYPGATNSAAAASRQPYVPGQTGYQPGNTGYQPPGVPPYQSPAGPYTSPGSSSPTSGSSATETNSSTWPSSSSSATAQPGSAYTPYLPGSTKPYTRSSSSGNASPTQGGYPTGSTSGADSQLQQADYVGGGTQRL